MKLKLLFGLLALPLGLSAGGLSLTLEEVIADRALWPTSVTVTSAARGTVVKDGKPSGAMLVGAGGVMTVTAITKDSVTGRLGSAVISVPIGKTDLLQRLGDVEMPAAPAAARRPPAPAPNGGVATAQPTAMSQLFAGKLVRYEGGRLVNVEPSSLNGVKYYALYYSAGWCGPCRQFTPGFLQEYARLKAKYPEFEAVFLSGDRSAGDMLGYMRDDRMTWPAVKYDQRNDKMMRYGGPGIPCLVLVDAEGRVLADSFVNGNYVGPRSVLEKTKLILKKG